MPDGRGARIALEAGFLVAVAAVLGFADVRPLWIVLVMTLAWVVVAVLEWVAWREEPHWASGSPPRYYVPPQPLPPRPPSEELPAFGAYPRAEPRATEAPTWIATPEMREELLGWPAPEPGEETLPDPEPPEPEPPVAEAEPEPDPVPLPAAEAEPQPSAEPQPVAEAEPVAETEPGPGREELQQELLSAASAAAEPEPEEPVSGWPIDDGDTETDPWLATELVEEREPASGATASDGAAHEQEPPRDQQEAPPPGARLARHRIDPFDASEARRWPWQRRAATHGGVAELPPLPRHVRLDREDGQ